jgi:uncharacterized protein YndB with AHSA1/START domain
MFAPFTFSTAIGLLLSASAIAQNKPVMISINHNAPVACSKTIIINATPEKVWSVMTDIDRWASWQTEISNPKLHGNLAPNSTFDWKTGGAKIHSTLHTVEPYKHFGWTGKTFGMKAIHNWTLTVENGQTRVSVDESMEGFLARLLKKSFNRNLTAGMQNWLDLLKKAAERS